MLNFFALQIGWFAAVLGAANQLGWPFLMFMIVYCSYHFRVTPQRKQDLIIMSVAAAVGLVADSLFVFAGLISYTLNEGLPLAPLWILGLWSLLGLSIGQSLRWVKRHWSIAAVAGMVSAPLSYWAGIRLGAAKTDALTLFLLLQGLTWALALPMLAAIDERLRVGIAVPEKVA